MKRRDFIKGSAALALAAGTADIAKALNLSDNPSVPEESSGKLLASAPLLENYAETSMGVAFAVNALANGYVLVGEKPDLSDARKVKCGGYRLCDISDKVLQVRLTGLKPATTYYYRIGADRIHYGGGYDMKVLGTEEDPTVYSFTTAGASARAHFCVINDTHVQWEPFAAALDKVAEINPSCVIWNGDASNTEETIEAQMKIFLQPEIDRKDYGARIPYCFCPGNHDNRGWANRHLENVWMYRQPEERPARDWDLGRNFAFRMGDIAMIGLDTAEDKLDTNPIFAGLFNSGPYREAQALWLKETLLREDIASAPYLVTFCHIPLFDPRPDENPGDLAPADTAPGYRRNWAAWQRTCSRLWGPLLQDAGCQLLITAHQHCYRYDAPAATGQGWAQIVGGGTSKVGSGFPTVIEGKIVAGELCVTVYNAFTGKICGEHCFAPRR